MDKKESYKLCKECANFQTLIEGEGNPYPDCKKKEFLTNEDLKNLDECSQYTILKIVSESVIRTRMFQLRCELIQINNKLAELKEQAFLQNSDLVYQLNLKLFIETLEHYDKYLLRKIFNIIKER